MFKHRLTRELAVIVGIKLVIVIAAGLFVFGPRERPSIDAEAVQARIDAPDAVDNGSLLP